MKTISTCSETADYSQVIGERILPFLFTLNEADSVLHPAEGEYQKFCYDVTGVGQNMPIYADLSHFLLGICDDISQEDIISVTVVIDGVSQEVKWGENIEIKTEEKPDPPTGCVGIKFDFPLNKVDGKMQICITLAQTYAIGAISVCVFGGNVTANTLTICGPGCGNPSSCNSTFYQKETVCVPVTVTPFATAQNAIARCCGNPIVSRQGSCSGGEKSCTFTVTQGLCIQLTLEFGADINTGTASVLCGDVSTVGCDCSDMAKESHLDEGRTVKRNRFLK